MFDLTLTAMAYVIYLVVSIAMSWWVARTLYRNGRVFLVSAFSDNEELADSVNHLLVVGFYLINIGYITLALRFRFGQQLPANIHEMLEFLSTKVGLVLVVLGALHLLNIYIFERLRRQANHSDSPRPDVSAFEE